MTIQPPTLGRAPPGDERYYTVRRVFTTRRALAVIATLAAFDHTGALLSRPVSAQTAGTLRWLFTTGGFIESARALGADEQLRGPYRRWIQTHTFEPREGGTLARDHVCYAVPFDWLVHRWLVRPDIERIFQFRARALQARFAASKAPQQ